MDKSVSNLRVGITGGIGSGKSFICRKLEALGYPVYDCDENAKRIMTRDVQVVSSLVRLVGKEIYQIDSVTGSRVLNKSLLASYIFGNPNHASAVNAIVHPAVKRDFLRWANQEDSDIIFLESAILYESGFDDVVDKVFFVSAPESVRIQRAVQRDHSSESLIRARIRSQASESEILPKADFVIQNDGVEDIDSQLAAVLAEIKKNI